MPVIPGHDATGVSVPRYDDLARQLPNAPAFSTWGMFGSSDDVGALNLVGANDVKDAAALVTAGNVFSLNWDIDQPNPPVLGRRLVQHRVIHESHGGHEDYYDAFYPQASSQWDSLCHVRHPVHGYYNGVSAEQVPGGGGTRLCIQAWAQRGIAGRFVLLDVARCRAASGRPINCAKRDVVTASDLSLTAQAQGVSPRRGDILLVRTGWVRWYEQLPQTERDALGGGQFPAPGLDAAEEVARWLWDSGFVAVAADCPAVEAMPFDMSSEETFLHYRLITLLGLAIGELFKLDPLAEYCANTRRSTGLLTSAPIQKVGGVGSPANALAIM